MYVTVKKWGNSHAIRLPKAITDTFDINENEKMEIITGEDGIIIKKARRHKTFEERMAGYSGDYKFTEMDSGEPVGKEIF